MRGKIFFRFMGILKKHIGFYLFTILGITVTLIIRQIYLAWILKDLFDYAASGNFHQLIVTVIVGLLVVTLLGILRPWFKLLEEKVVHRAIGELKKEMYQKITRLPIEYFSREHSGNIISRITNDIKDVETALNSRLLYLISFTLCAVCATIAMFFLDFWLALIALITAALGLICNAFFSRPFREVSRTVQVELGTVTETLTDLLTGVKVTRAFNLYNTVSRKFNLHNTKVYQTSLKRVRLSAGLAAMNDFGKMIDIIGVMGIGAYLSIQGKVSVGAIVAVWQLKTPILTFFKELGDLIAGFQAGITGAERVFAVLDESEEPRSYSHLNSDACLKGDQALILQGIDFGYRSTDKILKDLTLEVGKRQKVAIIGPSGEGKSTIFKLLLGFYPPEKGQILINGKSMGSSDLNEIRKMIAYVPQNAYLFSGSIKENICYGRMDATDEEIIAAAKMANAHDFISGFDDGYDTYVGERGAQISGGQRQRIGIARAILKDAPILLFDEATSALDAESEYLITDALNRLASDRAIVMVTHRFSAIQEADVIYVIAEGQVKEKGTHAELMKISAGLYRSLYEHQYDTLLEAM